MDLHTLPERIKAHKSALVNIVTPPICTERAEAYTRAYQANEDKPVIVQRALALQEHLRTRTIWIKHDELIVGNQASKVRAAPIFPEYTVRWIEAEIDELADRPGAGFAVSEEDKQSIHAITPYWRGKTVQDRCYGLFTDEQQEILASTIIKAEGNMTSGDAHLAVDNEKILKIGMNGLLNEVRQHRANNDMSTYEGLKKEQFYKSVEIVLLAIQEHMVSYADLALEMAQNETRSERKAELKTIAENCRHVAFHAPTNFWQALQLSYFVQLMLQIESNGHSVSFGRMDQFLNDYYVRDLESGTMNKAFALELLQSCWLKLLEVNKIRSGAHSKASAGSPLYQNVCIGGQKLNENGEPEDAVNPLSWAILESCGQLRSTQPNLSVRYHEGLNQEFLMGCIEVIKCGFGMPAFNNDEIVIPEFIKLGVEKEDAYNYASIGCIETAVPGKWGYRCTGMSFINFARILLAALNEGVDVTTGKAFLPHDKSLAKGNFESFDQVTASWAEQIRYYTRKSIEIDTVVDSVLEQQAQDIFCSSLVDDCLARGKTVKEGGAKYDWVSGLQVGIANLGNSLAAIKHLVFEEAQISQTELAKALEEDFDGIENEQLRQRLINFAPKYGNDDDYVDQLLADAYQVYIDELAQFVNTRHGRGPIGGGYYAGTSSISANVPFGASTMATPDGRKAKTPLAEGASPASGSDRLGPTAVYNSVGKIQANKILGGVLLNQKLSPAAVASEGDKLKLSMLIRTFFNHHKGWHVQYNIVSRETLLAAKKNPEQYRDLVVRVAGYSAFFTALSPDAQDDIIARTEHEL
ncbi:TPA: formate C-acetyltransferase/glycerol dehydratase family glycyl radical enzyme [Vibrio parahaemolyticus]|nr:formate C-acetyltransferase/glycerol dehydratase family glycyl radical enzyme [Vibrio parahaemolyticus]HCG5555413.1 formate C-acetyltransferase/glycerol dehydratase family glycyl radical enzyme [Vibrio parahaemolyticus]HCG7250161.1 formate C-acetyltransferase/glycerol dehydratase family glycyl radical enzyme [Vibrio parahaemolyticus]HCG7323619.1 formate C-acetyltransferase/glycerol dehydratase family glycyl radical enzyme [Vibrio parahaemolyticus]HCG7758435.1 formate C-acetyltransferase/glyc